MNDAPEVKARTEIRDGMRITWHQPIAVDDGTRAPRRRLPPDRGRPLPGDPHLRHLRARASRTRTAIRCSGRRWSPTIRRSWKARPTSTRTGRPPIRSAGCRTATPSCASIRAAPAGRPASWIRGCPREIDDLYQCIEWAGTQPWSNGKVGMLGISYYASNQWRVAGMHPPHLAAIIPWEGQNDRYRDSGYHGGILCQFQKRWAKHQVANIQYGRGDRAKKNPNTGESVAGPVTLSDEELAKNRVDAFEELKKHPLDDEWHRSRSADLSLVTHAAPHLRQLGRAGHPSARQLQRLHRDAGTRQKWLEAHGDSHWSLFSAATASTLQKRFFDHFLKGLDNGWDQQPRVQLNIRHPGERFVLRHENEWPLARTQWTKLYLDPAGMALSPTPRDAGGHGRVRGARRRRDVLDAAAGAGDRDHRPDGGEALRLVVDRGRRSLPDRARVRSRRARSSRSWAPPTRTRRSPTAGCAPRIAGSTRRRASRGGPITRTTASSR